ncbi:MAG: hypothetical protein LHW60_04300 [Candidatus Cloacimonetes bacterium]|jgi:hypothetical protein|nr:hypothetical protein [Candidatus Cloacimonadota bacterium]NLO43779.1 hypothetical protein [Candidatus Cloacimonadota bacterium]
MRTLQEKVETVFSKNTFFFNNKEFEQQYETRINAIANILKNLRCTIQNHPLSPELIFDTIRDNENGLAAILALTGLSNELFKRLLTAISIIEDESLSKLVHKDKWGFDLTKNGKIQEFSDSRIAKLIRDNDNFLKGIVNLFFQGASNSILIERLPLFELRKLSVSKIGFDINELLDTMVRYKEKGSYSGQAENNAEFIIKNLLSDNDILFQSGDLPKLIESEGSKKRRMDFIIPNKTSPAVIIESSYLSTTSSGQGDKAKTEGGIRSLLRKYYPKARFIGIVDGIGWYVRPGDLERMCGAFDDVFTLHPEEISRLMSFINEALGS